MPRLGSIGIVNRGLQSNNASYSASVMIRRINVEGTRKWQMYISL